MNKFDENLKKLAKEEKTEIPECVRKSIDDTLSNLPEKNSKVRNYRIVSRVLATAACFALTFLFILPNISVSYAHALEDVPVIGEIVRVVTIRNYKYYDDRHDLEVDVPAVEGQGEAVDYINKDIDELTKILVTKFYDDLELTGNSGYGSIHLDYEVVTDSREWFTLKLSVSEVAASSNQYDKYYHIDKKKGKIVSLDDLFKDESYKDILTQNIRSQMKEQMASDSNATYWMNEEEFAEPFTTINKDQNFWWDKEGNLVIAFDQYEVGPGSMGTPAFTIDRDLFKDMLRPEYR